MRRGIAVIALGAIGLLVVLFIVFGGGERETPASPPVADGAEAASDPVERGAYLTRVANCAGCHTERGGEPFAGGQRLETEFGTFHVPNITPDPRTGIGDWSRDAFRRALRQGERPDGSKLYPACPYPSFTHVEPADVDAIHAYLQSVPAVERPVRGHELDFPYGFRSLLGVWQALYFEPGPLEAAPDQDRDWQRGRYLVKGLGHCDDCHRARGTFGAVQTAADAPGGRVHGWYAPSLASRDEAGLQGWSIDDAARFLKHGKAEDAAMLGPMAGVVFDSLQHLSEADAHAMATYLHSLPEHEISAPGHRVSLSSSARAAAMQRGRTVYARSCGDCHGPSGEGEAGVVPLAGNRAVRMEDPTNVIHMIRQGGFPASTPGNPRPHGMPPFAQLSNSDLAAVTTYIRESWGNAAGGVSTIDLDD